jgi:hypothetical protein
MAGALSKPPNPATHRRKEKIMADFGPQDCYQGLAAAADLSAYQYRVVRLTTTANQVNVASHALAASPLAAIGILQNKPAAAGRAATVAYSGQSKAVAGAAVTLGQMVSHDGSGYVIDAVSGANIIGRALEAAGAAGEIIKVQLQAPVRWPAVA